MFRTHLLVGLPSNINNHRQACNPATPFMWPTPYAMQLDDSRVRIRLIEYEGYAYPPNAPESVALHRKAAIRKAR
jgi:hypothetical protein